MLGIMPLLATGLTGCGGDNDEQEFDNVAVCVDPRTEQRLDDSACDDDDDRGGGGGFAWYYFGGINSGRTYVAPAVGQRVGGGTFTKPSVGSTKLGGVAKSGGSVARGGFGGGGGGKAGG